MRVLYLHEAKGLEQLGPSDPDVIICRYDLNGDETQLLGYAGYRCLVSQDECGSIYVRQRRTSYHLQVDVEYVLCGNTYVPDEGTWGIAQIPCGAIQTPEELIQVLHAMSLYKQAVLCSGPDLIRFTTLLKQQGWRRMDDAHIWHRLVPVQLQAKM